MDKYLALDRQETISGIENRYQAAIIIKVRTVYIFLNVTNNFRKICSSSASDFIRRFNYSYIAYRLNECIGDRNLEARRKQEVTFFFARV